MRTNKLRPTHAYRRPPIRSLGAGSDLLLGVFVGLFFGEGLSIMNQGPHCRPGIPGPHGGAGTG
jgi:hypothetical protein